MADLLSEEDLEKRLPDLKEAGWALSEDRKTITKTYKYETFAKAFAFMARVAPVADDMDHHPDWTNVYNTVKVTLTTHDAGGLTRLDIALAERMDAAC